MVKRGGGAREASTSSPDAREDIMTKWSYLWWAFWANFIGIVIGNGFVTIVKYYITGKIL